MPLRRQFDMRTPSLNRGPAGRRPQLFARPRSARPARLVVALAALMCACLLASGLTGLLEGGADASGGTRSGGHGGTGQGGGRGQPVSRQRDVDLVREPVERRQPEADRPQGQAPRIHTVLIKSSDGGNGWSQFTPTLVAPSTTGGCGSAPGSSSTATTRRGGAARRRGGRKGADCLVIDAESRYEGRYAAADTYVDKLRRRIGAKFPTALSSFPYVDYHPGASLLRLPRQGRRALQSAPGLLARDRGQRRPSLQAHLHLQPRLQAAHPSAGPDVRQATDQPDPALSPARNLL